MAQNRNKYAKLIKRKTGEKVLGSTILPSIPKSISDIYITSIFGDRLDMLAQKYYGDVTLWWIIAQANHLGKGSLHITPGTQIRIPNDLQKIYSMLERRNTRG